MKRLLFVRHGSTDSNATGVMRGWSDDPLSDLGRWQAGRAAQFLRDQPPVECIYSSTLPRSIQTADIIAAALGLAVHSRDDLRELNLGTLEGGGERDLWGYFVRQANAEHDLSDLREVVFPGGESVSGFLARTRDALTDLDRRHAGPVLIVSHGVQTMVALGMWLEPDVMKWPAFRVDNCSVSEVVFEPAPRLVRLNDTRHLTQQGFYNVAG
jgi:probable phosphoglycerate mutase